LERVKEGTLSMISDRVGGETKPCVLESTMKGVNLLGEGTLQAAMRARMEAERERGEVM